MVCSAIFVIGKMSQLFTALHILHLHKKFCFYLISHSESQFFRFCLVVHNEMELIDHKGMEINEMYLSKRNEGNGIKWNDRKLREDEEVGGGGGGG